MSFHLVAYDASFNAATDTDIAAVLDSIMTIQNGHFVPQQDRYILWAMGIGANMVRARIITPTVRQITTPFIRPIEENASPGNLFHYADYRRNPLLVKAFEELQVNVTQDAGIAEREIALLALARTIPTDASNQMVYCMKGTSTGTTVANAWTQIAMTWQDTLPAGTYEVVGLEMIAATAIAARIIFEDQVDRPGCPCVADEDQASWWPFQNGGFGVWGRFNANRFPNIEQLNTAGVSVHTAFLYFRRVGP